MTQIQRKTYVPPERDYKTIAQIEAETDQVRYYRALDYMRAVALIDFLREIESEYGDRFRLVAANPKYLYNSSIKDAEEMEKTKIFCVGLYAKWQIDDTYYHLQMDDNVFQDAYISRSWKIGNDGLRSEYSGLRMNDVMYADVDFGETPETIAKLTENLHEAFRVASTRVPETYTRKLPAYMLVEKQEIYKC
jgi:hypothetical protein